MHNVTCFLRLQFYNKHFLSLLLLLTNQISKLFFFLLSKILKFFHQAFIVHSDLQQCVKIRKIKTK
jgi:hypothetical protein